MRKTVQISTAALIAGLLAIAPVGAQTINLGLNGGGASGDGAVTIDTNSLTGGLLGDGGGSSTGSTNGNVTLDLGDVTGGTGGSGGTTGTVGINLNDTGSDDLLDLGGDGTNSSVVVQLANDDGSAAADLFGSDQDEATISLGGLGTSGLGDLDVTETAGDTALTLDLFGGSDGSGGGGTSGGGTGGTGGTGGNGGTVVIGGGSGGGGSQTAALGRTNERCVTPSDQQISTLAGRHNYTSSTFSSWVGASQMQIVKINVCPNAVDRVQATLAANANVSRLQSYLGTNAQLRSGLSSKGYSAGDVIATDRNGATLIVYVM